MNNPDLLTICISAFIAVFILLTFLSGIMKIIIKVFPMKEVSSDSHVLLAAVTTTINNLYPNSKITQIEEV